MIKYTEGNAIDYVLEGPDKRILLHCCNAQGVMGSGIAKEIKERIPTAFTSYIKSGHVLGSVSFDIDCHVVNMVAQERYGYQKGMRYISYKALIECLDKIRDVWGEVEYVIPYKMGSDRAGGDWDTVIEICEGMLCNNSSSTITVVKLS